MALTIPLIEWLAAWCGDSNTLAEVRSGARSTFFGDKEPGTVNYLAGTGDSTGRERRFLGWFGFSFRLPDGKHPAEFAAASLLSGAALDSAVASIQGARYVMAVTTMVVPGKGVHLQLEDDGFDVDSRILSRELYKDDVLCAHIVPVGRRRWLVCPGWLVWPTRFGPGARSRLKNLQPDPIQVERFLQQRVTPGDKPKIEYPRDKTLEEAVARMTAAAVAADKTNLNKPVDEWRAMVSTSMKANDFNGFSQKVMKWVGDVPSIDEMNRWLGLAMNIWNTTPQPDRGGRTADEIFEEQKKQQGTYYAR